jgi:predicted RNase H-like HicB family nuclease
VEQVSFVTKSKKRITGKMPTTQFPIPNSPFPKLDYYLKLSYPITLYPDNEEGGYVVEIEDLPGCLSQGETLEEAIANINEARELWIETVYETGGEIPLPRTNDH